MKWKGSLREKKPRKHHQYDLHRKWLVNFLNVIALSDTRTIVLINRCHQEEPPMGLMNTRPWIQASFIGMAGLKSPFSRSLWQLCRHWVFSLFFCHHCAIDRRLNFLTLWWLEHTLGNHRVQDWLEMILSKKFLQCACPLLSKSFI